jgi:hypothetical protein
MATENGNLVGEKALLTSDNGVLTLTNYRVKYDAKAQGATKFVTITLDSVASCGLVTKSYPVLLILAAISAIAGIIQRESNGLVTLLFVALCFVAAYFLTRSGVITVRSNGGEHIDVSTKGMKPEIIRTFVEAVVEAKLKFIGKIDNR